jgi:hypothetical protein
MNSMKTTQIHLMIGMSDWRPSASSDAEGQRQRHADHAEDHVEHEAPHVPAFTASERQDAARLVGMKPSHQTTTIRRRDAPKKAHAQSSCRRVSVNEVAHDEPGQRQDRAPRSCRPRSANRR